MAETPGNGIGQAAAEFDEGQKALNQKLPDRKSKTNQDQSFDDINKG